MITTCDASQHLGQRSRNDIVETSEETSKKIGTQKKRKMTTLLEDNSSQSQSDINMGSSVGKSFGGHRNPRQQRLFAIQCRNSLLAQLSLSLEGGGSLGLQHDQVQSLLSRLASLAQRVAKAILVEADGDIVQEQLRTLCILLELDHRVVLQKRFNKSNVVRNNDGDVGSPVRIIVRAIGIGAGRKRTKSDGNTSIDAVIDPKDGSVVEEAEARCWAQALISQLINVHALLSK